MEVLSLSLAKEYANKMESKTYSIDHTGEREINEKQFIDNIKYGTIVVTQLCCYVESFLNSVLDLCIQYNGDHLKKCSVDEKLDIIFLYYKKNFFNIRSKHTYETYKKVVTIRNNLIHFKKPFICYSGNTPDIPINKISLSEFFSKDKMIECCKNTETFCKEIAKELGLTINSNTNIIACDEAAGPSNYVCE